MECSICYEAIDVRTTGCAELSCSHKFHLSCIGTWHQTNAGHTCPMCRKVAEPLERIAGSKPANEQMAFLTREEFENLLRAKGGVGTKIFTNLLGFDSTPSAERNSRAWFDSEILLTRKELDTICCGNGASALSDDEWAELSDYPYWSRHGSGGWIRVDRETLDKLLKANGGEGVSHEQSISKYNIRFDYNDSVPVPRKTFDAILEIQHGSKTSHTQWSMIVTTFHNDMSQPTAKADDFDWDAYGKTKPYYEYLGAPLIVETPDRLRMTREQIAGLLERLGSPATVEEFFDEEDWMHQSYSYFTLDELNARLEYLNTLHPTAQMGLLTVADFHSVRTRCMPPAEPTSNWSDNIQWVQHDSPPIRVILNPEEEQWDV